MQFILRYTCKVTEHLRSDCMLPNIDNIYQSFSYSKKEALDCLHINKCIIVMFATVMEITTLLGRQLTKKN